MKYMRCGDGVNTPREKLFDLVADPHERNDLIDRVPADERARYRGMIESRLGLVINRCNSDQCVE